MEATFLCSSSPLPPLSLVSGKSRSSPKMGFEFQKRAINGVVVGATRDPYEYKGGSSIDESMIVLRKRIHETKMVERNYEPPQEWMQWEKQCYASYDEYVCNVVGCLQSYLMNTRPSIALCLLLLITMSVPASTIVIVLRVLEVANGALSTVHLR